MLLQLARCIISLAACLAGLDALLIVKSLLMPFEVGLEVELLATLVTLERKLSRMHQHVPLQFVLNREAFPACVACVWVGTCMLVHVVFQFC